MENLVRRGPVRHAGIERIEDHVVAVRVIELGQVFLGRIVDDGGFLAVADLAQDLANEGRLAASGIADEKDVLALMPAGDTDDPALGFRQVKPLPKACPVRSQPADPGEPPAGTVIMSSGNDVRTLERNSFTALPGLGAILSDGEGKADSQGQQGGIPGSAKQLPERSPVNPLGKPGVKPAIIKPQRLESQGASSVRDGGRREPERHYFPMLGG